MGLFKKNKYNKKKEILTPKEREKIHQEVMENSKYYTVEMWDKRFPFGYTPTAAEIDEFIAECKHNYLVNDPANYTPRPGYFDQIPGTFIYWTDKFDDGKFNIKELEEKIKKYRKITGFKGDFNYTYEYHTSDIKHFEGVPFSAKVFSDSIEHLEDFVNRSKKELCLSRLYSERFIRVLEAYIIKEKHKQQLNMDTDEEYFEYLGTYPHFKIYKGVDERSYILNEWSDNFEEEYGINVIYDSYIK